MRRRGAAWRPRLHRCPPRPRQRRGRWRPRRRSRCGTGRPCEQERVDRHEDQLEDEHWDGDGEHRCSGVDVAFTGDVDGRDVEAGAGADDRAEHDNMPVAPSERATAMTYQHPPGWNGEVQPHREGECSAAEGDEHDLDRPTRCVNDSRDRQNGAEDHLTKCDDREQGMPFGDVVRMPRSAAVLGRSVPVLSSRRHR